MILSIYLWVRHGPNALIATDALHVVQHPTSRVTNGAVAPVQYKMSTEIPAGIAMPDQLNTRMGTLKYFDGFPDDASIEKLYGNLDFQRAIQAYLLGLVPVSQYANRKGIMPFSSGS